MVSVDSSHHRIQRIFHVTSLSVAVLQPPRFRSLGRHQLTDIATRFRLPKEVTETIRLISQVLPFRVNEYVLSNLIDWDRMPDDPIFRLVFPQHGMLPDEDERPAGRPAARPRPEGAARLVARDPDRLNPHPSGQQQHNVPVHWTSTQDARPAAQVPRRPCCTSRGQGQTCHAYCTYCFRWAQFVGDADLRFAAPGPEQLVSYLRPAPGGDRRAGHRRRPDGHVHRAAAQLTSSRCSTVDTVRTSGSAPRRSPTGHTASSTDSDADDLLRLFEQVWRSGRTSR